MKAVKVSDSLLITERLHAPTRLLVFATDRHPVSTITTAVAKTTIRDTRFIIDTPRYKE
ncbi:hypothetical protein [Mesotoga sp.]|uniref:hypothetical protein n=1 Tax=Mesotoga sp. TaxID=2053577 RepID=UPI00345E06BC